VPVDLLKIERLRKRAGLTQAEIAVRAGITKQRWNDIIKGRRAKLMLETVEHIAKALDVPIGDILLPI